VTSFPGLQRAAVLALLVPAIAGAQASGTDSTQANQIRAAALKAVTVTATRTATDVRDVAMPVVVIDSLRMRSQLSNGVADLLRSEPGVDVVGTGVNQARPSIRGQRGQRILLLQDGLRLNNSRRQQDFGEIPALVDAEQISRIEVVRGPASVLYGTDAIGGVVNLITRAPRTENSPLTGRATYSYGTAGTLGRTALSLSGASGRVAYELFGAARVVGDYKAPAGSYGKVKLAQDTPLQNSGVRDRNIGGSLSWQATDRATVFAKAEVYGADKSGFGYIPPTLIGADPTQIEITYPKQDFAKYTAGVRLNGLQVGVADRFDFTAYTQRNTRDLAQHIFAFFGPGTPPGAGVDITTSNHTNIGSTGFRAEASKVLSRAVVTYGADLYSDDSHNSDSSKTTVVGFGPPQSTYSGRPQVPNATLTSYGLFAQADLKVVDRLSVIVGARGQQTESSPKVTAGRTDVISSHSNGTAVYAANLVWRVTDDLSVVGTIGSGFRSPNLVERYFEGPTPEGSAYQQASPDLQPEQSVNVDAGLKYRNGRLTAEATVFQNDIRDAIVIKPTGAKQGRLPIYTNINIDKLRAKGVEAGATLLVGDGFTLIGNYSTLKSTNVSRPDNPVGDSYSSKTNLGLQWTDPTGRVWAEYAVRHNGEQKDIAPTASPVGTVLPAFTVQNVRLGIRGWKFGSVRQDVTVVVNNLGNVLYTEASNASFFRPEPGRHVILAISTAF
jgi:outer membrane receptor protein involved in Fe transport